MNRPQVERHTRSFSRRNARFLAESSRLAYEDPELVESTLIDQWGFRDFSFFDVNGTQAFVSSNALSVVVCFRGTERTQVEDWVADANLELVGGPLGGKVHAGFYDALSNVWQLVHRKVEQIDGQRSKAVWCTGHSLGASLATLAVSRWIDADRPVHGLYTFGQPRTGDLVFARNFNFQFKPYAFRMVNRNDLVTRVPPRALGYSHVGTFRYFPSPGQLEEDISWWSAFLDCWRVKVEDVLHWTEALFKPHSMNEYVNCIELAALADSVTMKHRRHVNDFLRSAVAEKRANGVRRAAS